MRKKIQVSTDVAALGIWDPAHRSERQGGEASTLERLAQLGEACIIRLGRDCGGSVDVYVDEEVPTELLAESNPLAEQRTVVVRSGEVVVDGIEHFGADSLEDASMSGIRNGIYRATIRITKDEDELPELPSEKEIRRSVGAEEVEYYDRTNRNGLLIGLSTLLLLPALLFLLPWFVAVPLALIVFVAYFHVQRWFLERNSRYQRVADEIARLRLAGERPILTVHLSRWHGELMGGADMSLHPPGMT